jgi:uncharacterized protein YbaA (DUF1428 family)
MKKEKVRYVDGYVLVVPRRKIDAYRHMAQLGGKIWRKHGALEFRECVGDDLAVKMGVPFPRIMKKRPSETVVFSWITFKSRVHRDRVNAKVMKDPRLANRIPNRCPLMLSVCLMVASKSSWTLTNLIALG